MQCNLVPLCWSRGVEDLVMVAKRPMRLCLVDRYSNEALMMFMYFPKGDAIQEHNQLKPQHHKAKWIASC